MHQWVNLFPRNEDTVTNPDREQMIAALVELFASDDDEHPDCWIECGTQNGELHSISIYSSGYAIFERFSDFDMSDELESKRLQAENVDAALKLWEDLINADYDKL